MPFKPGNNANPRGRPRTGRALAEAIRAKCGDDGACYVAELDRMALDKRINAKTRVEIMRLMFERGFGKPPTDIHVSSGSALDLTGVDLDKASDSQIEQLHKAAPTTARIVNELRGESIPVH